MARYFFHIAYNGAHYRGWQRQENIRSVQEVLETCLATALKLPEIGIFGCGRTDAEVHASQYFFHADLELDLAQKAADTRFETQKEALLFILNKSLPTDIAIFDIILMPDKAHARYDAVERVYDYFIHTYKDPFIKNYSSLYIDSKMDLDKMNAAVKLLPQYQDYGGLCKQPHLNKTTVCKVSSAKLFIINHGEQIRFRIVSNRFLRGQIRIIVQKLIDIGTGEFSIEAFETALANIERPQLIRPAHPQGLFLSKIVYPYLNLPTKATFTLPDESWQEI